MECQCGVHYCVWSHNRVTETATQELVKLVKATRWQRVGTAFIWIGSTTLSTAPGGEKKNNVFHLLLSHWLSHLYEKLWRDVVSYPDHAPRVFRMPTTLTESPCYTSKCQAFKNSSTYVYMWFPLWKKIHASKVFRDIFQNCITKALTLYGM